jgi:hypothetical protein
LLDVIAHALALVRDSDSFLDLPTPERGWSASWRAIADLGPADLAPEVPSPGEEAAELVERLLACAERAPIAEGELALVRARALHALQGAAAGAGAWRELVGSRAFQRESLRGAALTGLAAALLDLGQPSRALEILERERQLLESRPEPAWLAVFARALLPDCGSALASAQDLAPFAGRIPTLLAELRTACPDLVRALPGRDDGRERTLRVELSLAELGATRISVLSIHSGGRVRPAWSDALPSARAPALGGGAPSRAETSVLATGRVRILRRAAEVHLGDAALAPGIRALALAPIFRESGEVAGLLRLEFDHWRVPSEARLQALSERARARLPPAAIPSPRPALELLCSAPSSTDPRARILARSLADFGARLERRRAYAFALEGASWRLVHESGAALGDWRVERGEARIFTRAVAMGGPCLIDEATGELALHAQAGSGLAVPIFADERVLGLVLLESQRRRDFRVEDAERLAAALDPLALRVARFAASRRGTRGVWLLSALRAPFLADILGAARSTRPLALVGEDGLGKDLHAAWIHFETCEDALPYTKLRCADLRGLPTDLENPGMLVLDGLGDLAPPVQAALAERLSSDAPPPARLIALSRVPMRELAADGGLRPDLARSFERLELCVPPLRARRNEIPELAELLLDAIAAEEGRSAPRLTDEAQALLWRQSFPDNLRGLEDLLFRVVLYHAGEIVGAQALHSLGRRFGTHLIERLPPRSTDAADLAAALELTRKANGAVNQTRAALLLGWDKDTLAARLARDPAPTGRLIEEGEEDEERQQDDHAEAPRTASGRPIEEEGIVLSDDASRRARTK